MQRTRRSSLPSAAFAAVASLTSLARPVPAQGVRPERNTWAGAEDGEPRFLRQCVVPDEVRTWLGSTGRRARSATPTHESFVPAGPGLRKTAAGDAVEGDTPCGVAFTPDGAQILVAHTESRNVIVWDATTGAFVRAIAVSGSPFGLAVSSDGVHAVTANGPEDTASVLDLTSGLEVAVIPVGDQPGPVAISPDGTLAAVGNTVEGSISILDVAGGTELRRAGGIGFQATLGVNFENGSLSARFTQPAFAGNGKIVHPDTFADRLRIVDVATAAVTSVVVPDGPEGVAVSASGATAVVTCGNADSVAVVDVA